MQLTSPAFEDGAPIPVQHTCDGADRSPALVWQDAPAGTASYALLCEDPDAPRGTWDHWVMWNIPADAAALEEGVPPADLLPHESRQGVNSFGRVGYGGPCPPKGPGHRYFFRLFALDVAQLDLPQGAVKRQLLKAIEGHVLAEATLMGTYQR